MPLQKGLRYSNSFGIVIRLCAGPLRNFGLSHGTGKKFFLQSFWVGSGAHLVFELVGTLSHRPAVKLLGCDTDHSFQSGSGTKNSCNYTASPCAFIVRCVFKHRGNILPV